MTNSSAPESASSAGRNGTRRAAAKSLFARLGGAPAIEATVDEFYRRVLADDMLGRFFKAKTMPHLRQMQVDFFTTALGGGDIYKGKSLREAHGKMHLTMEHFNRVAGHLQDTLTHLGVDSALVEEVMAAVGTLADEVISGDPVRSAKFIDAVDGVLIEGGYFGPHYVGDPRKLWLRGLRFVEKMQAAGKTYYSIEVPLNGRPVTKDYLQFTLASYLLAKGHTARILLAQPTKSGYDSGNPDACWHPECDAPIGTPLGPMRQVAGDRDTENGVYLREHSGGVSIVNASTKDSFKVALPGGDSYTDLDGNSVGTTVAMRPVSGLVLLRKGAAKTKESSQQCPP